MVAVNVIAADDDTTAERLFTSAQQAFTNVIRGSRGQLPPPVDNIEAHWSPAEKAHVSNVLSRSYVGSPDTVREGLESVIAETMADELIVAAAIHDHSARVHSYEILAEVQQALSSRLHPLETDGFREPLQVAGTRAAWGTGERGQDVRDVRDRRATVSRSIEVARASHHRTRVRKRSATALQM